MLTLRDREVIISIGDHRILMRDHITDLHFPSYQTTQRRLREELIPNGYVTEPFYKDSEGKGMGDPFYRLDTKGIRIYKEMTGKEYNNPYWNLEVINRLEKVNNILVKLRVNKLVDSFELDYKIKDLKIDSYCSLKEGILLLDLNLDRDKLSRYENIYKDTDNVILAYYGDKSLEANKINLIYIDSAENLVKNLSN